MIGEFYLRTMVDLHSLFSKEIGNHTLSTQQSSLSEETQYYVHIAYETKKLLDGHKLMLSGMNPITNLKNDDSPSSSIRWAKSALDLFEPAEEGSCRCFQKLVFCGYNVTYTQQNASANASATNEALSSDENSHYTLWPSSFLDGSNNDVKGYSSSCEPVSRLFAQRPFECQAFAKLKSYLLSNIESHYDDIDETIADYRRQILRERDLISKSYRGDTKEWVIVGLAQRSSRRVWLNLQDAIEECSINFIGSHTNLTKVVCIEVNVENTATPQEQFLLHRALDVLIGVHGAQMTQALFLPPRAHVLELLPWIPVSI